MNLSVGEVASVGICQLGVNFRNEGTFVQPAVLVLCTVSLCNFTLQCYTVCSVGVCNVTLQCYTVCSVGVPTFVTLSQVQQVKHHLVNSLILSAEALAKFAVLYYCSPLAVPKLSSVQCSVCSVTLYGKKGATEMFQS